VPVIICFSCRDSKHLNSGEEISSAVNILEHCSQVIGIGVNCTKPEYIHPIVLLLKQLSKKYIIVYPNSGEWDCTITQWNPELTQKGGLARLASCWRNEGARIIGGCCRAYPEDIRIIRDVVHGAN